jgi:hypothetical protein
MAVLCLIFFIVGYLTRDWVRNWPQERKEREESEKDNMDATTLLLEIDALGREILTLVDDVPPPEPPLEVVCAWCFPGDTRPGINHSICKKHLAEQLAKMEIEL